MKLRILFETHQDLQRWIPALKSLRKAISNRFRRERMRIDHAKSQGHDDDRNWVIRNINNMFEHPLSLWLSERSSKPLVDLMSAPAELEFHVDDKFSSHSNAKRIEIHDDHVGGDIEFPKEIEEVLIDMVRNLKRATYNYAMETDET